MIREAARRAAILITIIYAAVAVLFTYAFAQSGEGLLMACLFAAGYAVLAGIGWVLSALIPRQ